VRYPLRSRQVYNGDPAAELRPGLGLPQELQHADRLLRQLMRGPRIVIQRLPAARQPTPVEDLDPDDLRRRRRHVAERLMLGERVVDPFEALTVSFIDIVGFTKISAESTAIQMIDE
jgi:class 3 adenylate cyclase